MSEAYVTLYPDTDHEVTLPLVQVIELRRCMEQLTDPCWHFNDCGCCIAVHERVDHAAGERATGGFIVGADGGSDWITIEEEA